MARFKIGDRVRIADESDPMVGVVPYTCFLGQTGVIVGEHGGTFDTTQTVWKILIDGECPPDIEDYHDFCSEHYLTLLTPSTIDERTGLPIEYVTITETQTYRIPVLKVASIMTDEDVMIMGGKLFDCLPDNVKESLKVSENTTQTM